MADDKHPNQKEPNPTSENMDNKLKTDLDYDEITSQPSQNTSASNMDDTLENDENRTELLEYRPPDNHNNTDKKGPKTNRDQNQTRRSQRRHNTPTTTS